MIKAVIFDFDGVIVNSDAFNVRVLCEIFKKHQIPLSEADFFTYFAGKKLVDALTHLLTKFNRQHEVEAFIAEKRTYDHRFPEEVEVYPAAIETLKECAKNYRIALATGSRRAVIDLFFKKHKIAHLFSNIITAEDCKHGKPHPEPYIKTVEKLKLSPTEAIVIEDAPAGIKAARAAQIPTIALAQTHPRSQLTQANYCIETISELPLFLKSLLNED